MISRFLEGVKLRASLMWDSNWIWDANHIVFKMNCQNTIGLLLIKMSFSWGDELLTGAMIRLGAHTVLVWTAPTQYVNFTSWVNFHSLRETHCNNLHERLIKEDYYQLAPTLDNWAAHTNHCGHESSLEEEQCQWKFDFLFSSLSYLNEEFLNCWLRVYKYYFSIWRGKQTKMMYKSNFWIWSLFC